VWCWAIIVISMSEWGEGVKRRARLDFEKSAAHRVGGILAIYV
jgi:hypothetical protein